MNADAPRRRAERSTSGRILYDIAHLLGNPDTQPDRVSGALDLLRDLIPYEGCALLLEPPGGETHVVFRGTAEERREPLAAAAAALFRLLGRRAASTPSLADPEPTPPPYASYLAVPLVGRELMGLLVVGAERPDAYHDDDVTLLSVVASQLAAHIAETRLRARNERLVEEARAASAAKDRLLATVSHELRGPLNAILGWCAVLRLRLADDPALVRALDTIERSAHQQARLVEELVDLSRIETGGLRLEAAAVRLDELLERVLDGIRPSAQAKGVDVAFRCEGEGVVVHADADRLEQAFRNIVGNAVKFTPRAGRIEVVVEGSGAEARVHVTDTGIGIRPELLPHVFEAFLQGRRTASAEPGGLGLGLAIVKRLIDVHHGTVEARSEGAGRGATFTVSLPLEGPHDVGGKAPT
jgi:signal transduction histidine kinase